MMVRHRSPESLASHGRRTTITWSCKTTKRKRTVPPGLVWREAAGRPQCRPRRRRRPNCRIGRGVGLLRCRRSCVFWQRLTPPPMSVGSEQSCALERDRRRLRNCYHPKVSRKRSGADKRSRDSAVRCRATGSAVAGGRQVVSSVELTVMLLPIGLACGHLQNILRRLIVRSIGV